MNRKIYFVLIFIIICGVQPLFSQEFEIEIEQEIEQPEPVYGESESLDLAEDVFIIDESQIPFSIRYNEYYRESLRLTKLAQDTYEYGDYDTAAAFAQEAIRFAQLSDAYIMEQLKKGIVTGTSPLPAQYTVRTWVGFRDCLWNIAGRSWAYGDPHKWREIYNANRSKLPEPGNPDLLEPGIVLIIPSIKGETRQGMWDSAKAYPAAP
jgi:hypothetical protein